MFLLLIFTHFTQSMRMIMRGTKVLTKAGYLSKRGGSHRAFKKRWCVFENGALFYYKDKADKEPAGIIYSEDMNSIAISKEDSKDHRHPFAFDIQTPERMFVFCADSIEETNQWISVIKSAWDETDASTSEVHLNFATVESFVSNGIRVNGQLDPAILGKFSEGMSSKQKRKDDRGWYAEKHVPCALILSTMATYGWELVTSLKAQSFIDGKYVPCNMMVFSCPNEKMKLN